MDSGKTIKASKGNSDGNNALSRRDALMRGVRRPVSPSPGSISQQPQRQQQFQQPVQNQRQQQQQTSSTNKPGQQIPPGKRDDLLKKKDEVIKRKEKMDVMRQFLTLRRKIYHNINIGSPEEAKDTYDALYSLYQEMLKSFGGSEAAVLNSDMTEVYAKLEGALNKKVKKGHFMEVEKEDTEEKKKYKKKIVTTDLDIVMQIVEEKGRMNLAEIQAKFNISKRLAEEWIQILADYGLVEIRYLPIGGVEISKVE